MTLLPNLICGLLGFGTGIFTVLSLIEKPAWWLMHDPRSERVSDDDVRAIHAILKRVIHMLPPTMITTMTTVSVLVVFQLFQAEFSRATIILGRSVLRPTRSCRDSAVSGDPRRRFGAFGQ